MKALRRKFTFGLAVVALAGALLWQFSPVQAVLAVASLSDPAKLATLGERGANPRLNKIVYWLDQARNRGLPAGTAVRLAQLVNHTTEPRAALVRESLLRNLQIAERLGLLTADNRDRLRHGKAAIVTRGPYARSPVEIDHIVPYSLAKEAGNELANLEMLPEPLNRRKSNRVGERQAAHARRLFQAGLISKESLARVEARRN
jgi:predicted DNA-binding protein